MSKHKFDIEYIDENSIRLNGEIVHRMDFDYPGNTMYCYRSIFINSEWVVKLDVDDQFHQSKREYDLWKTRISKSQFKKYFVPVVCCKYVKKLKKYLVVQPRIDINEDLFLKKFNDDKDNFSDLVYEIAEEFNLIDITNERNSTVDSCGNLLIFDYGL